MTTDDDSVGRGEICAKSIPDPARGQIEVLTGIRGMAIVVVLLAHFSREGYLPEWMFRGAGQLGVMIFFLLSGFLMARLYLHRKPDSGTIAQYAAARAGRVLPLFFVIVLLSASIRPILPIWPYPVDDVSELLRHLLFVEGVEELWAIPVEVQFYAIFAATWIGTHWIGSERPAITFACLLAVGVVCIGMALANQLGHLSYRGGFYYAHYFLIGAAIALVLPWLGRFAHRLRRPAIAGPASVAVLVLFATSFPTFRQSIGLAPPIWLDPLVALSVVLLFLFALFGVGIFRLAETRVFVGLGVVSYGLYLIHPIVIALLADPMQGLPGLAQAGLVLAVSLALAALSYRWLEMPALARIRGLARPGTRRAADVG